MQSEIDVWSSSELKSVYRLANGCQIAKEKKSLEVLTGLNKMAAFGK